MNKLNTELHWKKSINNWSRALNHNPKIYINLIVPNSITKRNRKENKLQQIVNNTVKNKKIIDFSIFQKFVHSALLLGNEKITFGHFFQKKLEQIRY